ncbi:MAG: pyridoxal phosphate-dependent aminotransferase, partial [Pseudoflavonifractor sp.]
GLLFAMMPFLNPGDEVLVPDPSYPSNFLDPTLLGAKAVSVCLREEDNFSLDLDAFRAAITPRTKMVLLTNPNNPTGTVFGRGELEELAALIVEHDLILVVDQAFEDSVFDGREMVSMAALPGMWERTVSVFSISKGMGLSGFRVGYVVADDHVIDVMYGCAVNVIGATNTTFQLAAIEAFRDLSFMEEYRAIFDRRRKEVYALLGDIPGVTMTMPQAAFLTWLDVRPLGTSEEVAAYLKKNARVFVNEGTPYGTMGAGHLRLVHGCFADDERLYAAIRRIRTALLALAGEKHLI